MSILTSEIPAGAKVDQSAEQVSEKMNAEINKQTQTSSSHPRAKQHFINMRLPELAKHLQVELTPGKKTEEEKTTTSTEGSEDIPSQFDDRNQIFFGCTAPLRPDFIDINLQKTSETELSYCCGFLLPVDCSFFVDTILSAEFLTGVTKQASMYENDKRVAVFVHGGALNFQDKTKMAEHVLNESILFYKNMPCLTIPFIWPAQDRLFALDSRVKLHEKVAEALSNFVMRLWTKFDQVDLIGHGRGCVILMQALSKLLEHENAKSSLANSHFVFIAPDVPAPKFRKCVREKRKYVKKFTLYVNTNDWALFASKFLNWSKNRAGATTIAQEEVETIDTSNVLYDWKSSNHYYLTNPIFKRDIIDALNGSQLSDRAIKPLQHENGNTYYELI